MLHAQQVEALSLRIRELEGASADDAGAAEGHRKEVEEARARAQTAEDSARQVRASRPGLLVAPPSRRALHTQSPSLLVPPP